MNNYGIIHQGELQDKESRQELIFDVIRFTLNHLLNLIGVAVFWIYMIALLLSPVWVPWLVNRLLPH